MSFRCRRQGRQRTLGGPARPALNAAPHSMHKRLRGPTRRRALYAISYSGFRRRQSRTASRAHSRQRELTPRCIRRFAGNSAKRLPLRTARATSLRRQLSRRHWSAFRRERLSRESLDRGVVCDVRKRGFQITTPSSGSRCQSGNGYLEVRIDLGGDANKLALALEERKPLTEVGRWRHQDQSRESDKS